MVDFKAVDLRFDGGARTVSRGGRTLKLTATQAMLLEWLDGAVTPSLEFCCDELWEAVDPEWVCGQWDKLALRMAALGVAPMFDDADMLALHHVDAEGNPVALVREVGAAEISAPSNAAEDISDPLVAPASVIEGVMQVQADDDARIAGLEALLAEARTEINRLLCVNEAAADEIARLRRDCDGVSASCQEWAKEVEAAKAAVLEMHQSLDRSGEQLDEARANFATAEAALATANDRNAELAARVEQQLKARLEAGREAASAQEPARDTPVALSPRHVTIPVSESLYRWLEGTALRNRCSPEHVASRLILALRQSVADDARARAA
jgi:hypothetical protein